MMLILTMTETCVFAAGNYHDTVIEFYTDNSGGDWSTTAREKWDYTSSYAYNKASDCGWEVCILGSNNKNTLGNDCSVTPYQKINVGQASYIKNYVKERSYKYARLKITPDWHYRAHIYGLWSPDSI